MNDDLPSVKVSPVRKVFFSGASIIWIIPLLALVVALGVAWQTYNDRGPLIVVEFEKGAGIKASETELRFRDVTVGVVEKVGFTDGLERVVASIRVDKEVAPFIDSGAIFWIVQPEVTAQGITGLSTVLSGVYIEGSWDDIVGSPVARFQGSSDAPLIRPGQSGLEIAFRTVGSGQLTDNAPILFKGIEVGRVGQAKIAPRGNFAIVEALIYDEHRDLINESTRFWDASGFSVTIGPAGAEIDFSSLATLIGGGITFDTFISGGGRVSDGTVFEIFPDKESARNSVFNASEVEPLKLGVIFDDNISGLAVGAPVELSGLKIGEVEALAGIVDFDQFGDSRVRLDVVLSIQPARLGLPGDVTAENALNFLQGRVRDGLRARLASASLLTGGLKIELVTVEDAEPAELAPGPGGAPVLPTTDSEVSDAAATVEGVFTRINNLPIEQLLNSAINFLNSAEALVNDRDLRETPQDVRILLAQISDIVGSEDTRNIPVALNATLTSIEALVAQLEADRVTETLTNALNSAASAAEVLETSVVGLPEMINQITSVAAKAETLELEQLITELTDLTRSIEAMVGNDDAVQLPSSLNRALTQLNDTLEELRAGDLSGALIAALNNAASAATSVESSLEGMPQMVNRITAVATKAETLELEELVSEVTALTRSVQNVLGSDDAAQLPAAFNQALTELNATLAELRESGATQSLITALDNASSAATAVETSVAGLPALIDQISAVAAKAETLELNELVDELTDLTRSVDAVVGTEDAVQLPRSLKRALDELNYTLQELREGGAIENVNRTLASARNAADNIAVTAQDLPQVVDRLTRLFNQASRTLEGYDKGDQLSRSAQETLRDIQKAADALASLARTIERNPNSLLLGR